MENMFRLLCVALIAIASGCSSDAAKRTAYETLQNAHEQECMRNPAMKCEKRKSYDEYKQKRKELDSPNY